MTAQTVLPGRFGHLAGLVAEWSIANEPDRFKHRLSCDVEKLKLFYDAMFPHMDEILVFLADYPAEEFRTVPENVRNLYHLALHFMEASHPIDLRWRRNDIDDAFPAERIEYPLNLG